MSAEWPADQHAEWAEHCEAQAEDFADQERGCERCGGEGFLEYDEAGPDVWGEDCPSEINHLVTCPDCRGEG